MIAYYELKKNRLKTWGLTRTQARFESNHNLTNNTKSQMSKKTEPDCKISSIITVRVNCRLEED